jgi:hypothetical protein
MRWLPNPEQHYPNQEKNMPFPHRFKLGATLAAFAAATAATAQIPVVGGPSSNPTNIANQLTETGKVSTASTEFLSLILDVPAKDVQAVPTALAESAATVKAVTPTKVCDLELIRNATANKHGWVVQKHACSNK